MGFSGVQPVSSHKDSNAKPVWATVGLLAMQNNGASFKGVVSIFQTKVCMSIVPSTFECVHSIALKVCACIQFPVKQKSCWKFQVFDCSSIKVYFEECDWHAARGPAISVQTHKTRSHLQQKRDLDIQTCQRKPNENKNDKIVASQSPSAVHKHQSFAPMYWFDQS